MKTLSETIRGDRSRLGRRLHRHDPDRDTRRDVNVRLQMISQHHSHVRARSLITEVVIYVIRTILLPCHPFLVPRPAPRFGQAMASSYWGKVG